MPFNAFTVKRYWNAEANSPYLVPGRAENGDAYLVSVPGTTRLGQDGDWAANDIALFSLDRWVRIPAGGLAAVGDGYANDTAAMQAALNRGGRIKIPAGTYMVDSLLVTKKVDLRLAAGATIKLRSISSQDIGVFHFSSGAKGSRISGSGTIDGNRSALLAAHLALPKSWYYGGTAYTIEVEANGIFSEACEDLTIEGITIKNCLHHAIAHRGGDNPKFREISVVDCCKVLNAQFFSGGRIGEVTAAGIGNQVDGIAVPFWQPAWEVRNCVGTTFQNLVTKTFAPKIKDAGGTKIGDPLPICFSWERMYRCRHVNLDAGTYVFDPADTSETGAARASIVDYAKDSVWEHIFSENYYWGEEYDTMDGGYSAFGVHRNVRGNVAGGSYAESAGLRVRGNGINPFHGGTVDADYRASSTGRDFFVFGKQFYGFTSGAQILSGGIHVKGNKFHGAVKHGIQVLAGEPNSTSFPNAPALAVDRVVLESNDCQYNGLAGVDWRNGDGLMLLGNILDNNGQRTGSSIDGVAVRMASSTARDGCYIHGGTMRDTQSFTKTAAASFVPGITDADKRKMLVVKDTSNLGIGQYIDVKNATGAGDIRGRIISIELDDVEIECASAQTFSETGNTAALSGTWTVGVGGQILAGTGGAATTEITGACYIKIGSEYLRVAKVTSDNSIQVVGGAVSAHTGATASLVRCNLAGVQSQKRPLYIEGATTTNVSWADVVIRGNVNDLPFVVPGNLAGGQEFVVEYETALSTAFSDTLVAPQVYSASDNVTPLEAALIVTETVTGTTGTITLLFGTDVGSATARTGIALAKNSKWNGSVPGGIHSFDNLYCSTRIEGGGGGDNVPSAGSVKARFKFRKMETKAFSNV